MSVCLELYNLYKREADLLLKHLEQSLLVNADFDYENVDLKLLLTNIILLIHTNPDLEFSKIKMFLRTYYGGSPPIPANESHPINVLLFYQQKFEKHINAIESMIDDVSTNDLHILRHLRALNAINQYYNVKEKLLFPLLERYGQYQLPRRMWEADDYLRVALRTMIKRVEKHETIETRHILSTFREINSVFNHLKDSERYVLYPLCLELLSKNEWIQVAEEAAAFNFDMTDFFGEHFGRENHQLPSDDKVQHRLGGGFLTMKEVNLILNNLPLELTFIDAQGIFKYFNNKTEASEMIFVRTPLSIGRHVANCHPPKSLSRMMQVMRTLKSKEVEKVTMWFKKGQEFIHVTYTGVFDEEDTFVGVLEYVQDIQPFLELPRTTKKHM